LAGIQGSLEVKGADYSILRVFASWPGEPAGDIEVPDQHPFATLNLGKFTSITTELSPTWFQGGVKPKRGRGDKGQDSESSRPLKRAKLETFNTTG